MSHSRSSRAPARILMRWAAPFLASLMLALWPRWRANLRPTPHATRSTTLPFDVVSGDMPGPLVNTVVVTGTDSFSTAVTDSATVAVAIQEASNPLEPATIFLPRLHRYR